MKGAFKQGRVWENKERPCQKWTGIRWEYWRKELYFRCARYSVKSCTLVVSAATMTLYSIKLYKVQEVEVTCPRSLICKWKQGSGAKAHEFGHGTVLRKREDLVCLPSYMFPPLCSLMQGRKEKQGEDMAIFSYSCFVQDVVDRCV